MKLFVTSLCIALKHSRLRLLCLFCIFVLCLGLLWGVTAAQPTLTAAPKAHIAVRCLDDHPLIPLAMQMVSSEQALASVVEIHWLTPEDDTSGYTAVVTIPQGFVESVMNGQNLSPLVEVNLSSPLEAAMVRQLAAAAAQTLTAAQQGVYAAQEAMDYGREMPRQQYQLLLTQINLTFFRAFAQRLELLETRQLSATGGLSLPGYYLAGLAAMLLFAYSFLYLPAVDSLRRFSVGLAVRQRLAVLAAVFAHLLVLSLGMAALLLPLARMKGVALGAAVAAWLGLGLLTASFTLLVTLLFSSPAACGAGSVLLALGLGLCSGGLLPLPFMPAAFGSIAPLLPTYYARLWAGILLGGSAPASLGNGALAPLLGSGIYSLVLLAVAVWLWLGTYRGREVRLCAIS